MNVMNVIEGMFEDFKQARVVYLTTLRDGEERSRPMTNFNEDPYSIMVHTYRGTRKVDDINENQKLLFTFPSSKEGEYYEIEGRAECEDEGETSEKWKWRYLHWHPVQNRRFWFPRGTNYPDRMIINVYPKSVRVVKKDE